MSDYVRTYRFLGHGILWDADKGERLCKFDRNGVFETSDPAIIRKMIKMRIPYDDGKADELANSEYAIELLSERVNILEQMNEDLRTQLERYKAQKEVDSKPSRAALLAEADYYGIPYLPALGDATIAKLIEEYKTIMRIKSTDILGEPDGEEYSED